MFIHDSQKENTMRTDRTAPKDIDEYIAGFPSDVRTLLQKIRMTIIEAFKDELSGSPVT